MTCDAKYVDKVTTTIIETYEQINVDTKERRNVAPVIVETTEVWYECRKCGNDGSTVDSVHEDEPDVFSEIVEDLEYSDTLD